MDKQKITLTLPPMVADQTGWRIYAGNDFGRYPRDARTRFERIAYSVLMYLHDRAEDVWHWLYRASRRYAPPSYSVLLPVEPKLYGYVAGQIVVPDKE